MNRREEKSSGRKCCREVIKFRYIVAVQRGLSGRQAGRLTSILSIHSANIDHGDVRSAEVVCRECGQVGLA